MFNFRCLIFTLFVSYNLSANSNTAFHFDLDSTGYQASIKFVTELPADSALKYMYEYEHFLKYKTGLGNVGITDSTASSYTIITKIKLPFYIVQIRLKRTLNTAEGNMKFELVSFDQSPELMPRILQINGIYAVYPDKTGSIVALLQTARNGTHISALQKIILESSIKNYFSSIQRHLQKNRRPEFH